MNKCCVQNLALHITINARSEHLITSLLALDGTIDLYKKYNGNLNYKLSNITVLSNGALWLYQAHSERI